MAVVAGEIIEKEVICSKFEELKLTEIFHGIWACASLLHVNKNHIVDVIKNVSLNLKPNGVFYMSFKYAENEYIDEKGRYFNCYTEKTFSELITKIKDLKVRKIYKTTDVIPGRGDITWLNILCIKVN